jgi:nickel-dependent lactate racemase
MEALKKVELTAGAWFGDHPITLDFPSSWEINILGNDTLPSLSLDKLRAQMQDPIGAAKLCELPSEEQRVVIVVDDITRPTPVATIILIILEELDKAGVNHESISIIIAGGTHAPASKEDIEKKVGKEIAATKKVVAHDPKNNLVYLGKSSRGTPLYINKTVVDSDLLIGVGCIYPHPAAGFAGGSKIIAPGVCGSETVRYLHDYIKGGIRGKHSHTELKQEMEEIATRVGLDFIVNVVLNQKREIAALFAGDKVIAHRKGVEFATEKYSIEPAEDADIIIMDVYPFDMSFQFAKDRGLWQLEGLRRNVSKVVIADFPAGLGNHELYPVNKPFLARISRRIKNFQVREFRFMLSKVRAIKKILTLRNQEIMMYSNGITETELRSVFPKASLFSSWNEIIQELSSRHKNFPVKVALYRCSPYLIPN